MLTRRSLLAGLGALVAAPAVITTPGLLMPVRTIAAVGWVFDPVAMATRCVASMGEIDHVYLAKLRHPITGEVRRYMRPISRPLQIGEARARVAAFTNGAEQRRIDNAAHDRWIAYNIEVKARQVAEEADLRRRGLLA